MTLGWNRPLYMLAFDHRASFSKNLLGFSGALTTDERDRVSDAKRVIYDAFELALADGADARTAGLLVDEEFGADVARRARTTGASLAMPVERSGQDEFDFEFGEAFGHHVESFDPSFAKVLVRYNPDGDRELNRRQAARLRRLSDWLHERDRKFLFELLVPATADQLAAVDGSKERYDAELRPDLTVRIVSELQAAGVEPDIWKIEGFEARADCELVADQARSGGRVGVVCIVLGRGADEAKVVHWLRQGAGVRGYAGFAVGRTLWWEELVAWVGGDIDGAEASARIATNYLRLIGAYDG